VVFHGGPQLGRGGLGVLWCASAMVMCVPLQGGPQQGGERAGCCVWCGVAVCCVWRAVSQDVLHQSGGMQEKVWCCACCGGMCCGATCGLLRCAQQGKGREGCCVCCVWSVMFQGVPQQSGGKAGCCVCYAWMCSGAACGLLKCGKTR
jgi:hypothetical protein